MKLGLISAVTAKTGKFLGTRLSLAIASGIVAIALPGMLAKEYVHTVNRTVKHFEAIHAQSPEIQTSLVYTLPETTISAPKPKAKSYKCGNPQGLATDAEWSVSDESPMCMSCDHMWNVDAEVTDVL